MYNSSTTDGRRQKTASRTAKPEPGLQEVWAGRAPDATFAQRRLALKVIRNDRSKEDNAYDRIRFADLDAVEKKLTPQQLLERAVSSRSRNAIVMPDSFVVLKSKPLGDDSKAMRDSLLKLAAMRPPAIDSSFDTYLEYREALRGAGVTLTVSDFQKYRDLTRGAGRGEKPLSVLVLEDLKQLPENREFLGDPPNSLRLHQVKTDLEMRRPERDAKTAEERFLEQPLPKYGAKFADLEAYGKAASKLGMNVDPGDLVRFAERLHQLRRDHDTASEEKLVGDFIRGAKLGELTGTNDVIGRALAQQHPDIARNVRLDGPAADDPLGNRAASRLAAEAVEKEQSRQISAARKLGEFKRDVTSEAVSPERKAFDERPLPKPGATFSELEKYAKTASKAGLTVDPGDIVRFNQRLERHRADHDEGAERALIADYIRGAAEGSVNPSQAVIGYTLAKQHPDILRNIDTATPAKTDVLGDRAHAESSAKHLKLQFASDAAKHEKAELLSPPSRLDAQPPVKNGPEHSLRFGRAE